MRCEGDQERWRARRVVAWSYRGSTKKGGLSSPAGTEVSHTPCAANHRHRARPEHSPISADQRAPTVCSRVGTLVLILSSACTPRSALDVHIGLQQGYVVMRGSRVVGAWSTQVVVSKGIKEEAVLEPLMRSAAAGDGGDDHEAASVELVAFQAASANFRANMWSWWLCCVLRPKPYAHSCCRRGYHNSQGEEVPRGRGPI